MKLPLLLAALLAIVALPAAPAHTGVGFASCPGTLVGPLHGGAAVDVYPQGLLTTAPVLHVHLLLPYGAGATCVLVGVQTPV